MSNSKADINVAAVYEPRLELANKRTWVVVRGAETVTYYTYPSTSFSQSNFNFTCNPPSKNTVLDRIAIIEVPVQITFTGTGTDNLLQPNMDAFRQYPISSITTSLTASVNGFSIPIELNQIIHALSRFHMKTELRKTFLSISPQMADSHQNYADANGSSNNPLAQYSDNVAEPPRGAYPYTVVSNTPGSAVITAVLREYVFLPPFLFDGSEAGGLTMLDTLQFNWILGNNLPHMWSHSTASTSTITGINVVFSQPSMLLGFLTPRLTEPIPPMITYPFFQLARYTTSGPLFPASGSSATQDLKSNVIQLNSIPRKMYVFARRSDLETNSSISNQITTTDTFFKINSINISWDNTDGILSGATPPQLYQFGVRNGLDMSFVEWNGVTNALTAVNGQQTRVIGLTGGILCLEPGVDFGLRSNQAEGMLGQYNLQIRLNITNISGIPMTPDLYIICVYDGLLHVSNNSAWSEIGVVTPNDVLNAPLANISYTQLEKMYGGDFFSKFKNVLGDIGRGISRGISAVRPVVEDAYRIGKAVAPLVQYGLPLVGLGEGGGCSCSKCGGVLVGGCCPMCTGKGGVRGGRMLSRKDLRRRIKG